MNKKGQIFLICAIWICITIVVILTQYNTLYAQEPSKNYDSLKDNYETELTMVRNKAISEGRDPDVAGQEFTNVYLKEFAKEQDPNFGIISIYKNSEGDIIIRNSMLAGNWITIESDVASTSQVLLSGYDDLEGEISIEGLGNIGNTKLHSDLNTFGEELSTIDVGDSEKITICIPGYGEAACFNVDNSCSPNEPDCDTEWNSKNIIVSQSCIDETGNPSVLGQDDNQNTAYKCTQTTST